MGLGRAARAGAAAAKLTAPFVVIAVAATAGYGRADTPSPGTARVAASGAAAIDKPAEDRFVPPEAAVNVKEFGAKGNGRTDDTKAIQRAISTSVGLASSRKVLYFPKGTYIVSRSLVWKDTSGRWATALTLVGQNRDRTVIKLANGAKGFGNRRALRAMIVTASQNAISLRGEGNQAFSNYIFDLTVDVGTRNPGAIGIDYLANNRGAIRNVVVRAPAGSGAIGIAMQRKWPGPCLLQNVAVRGFSKGIVVSGWEYSVTMEDIRLSGQRTVGMDVLNNVVSVRRLVSNNRVPALRSGSGGTRDGLVTLLDSRLVGHSRLKPAIDNSAALFLSRVSATGYAATVRDFGRLKKLGPLSTYGSASSSRRLRALPAAPSLKDAPADPAIPASGWTSPLSYGGAPNDWRDDTDALQAALDSGRPGVYLTPGRYVVTRTLNVPDSVRFIAGYEAEVQAVFGDFATGRARSVFLTGSRSSSPLLVTQIIFRAPSGVADVERTGSASRPLHLRDIHFNGRAVRGGRGDIFLTNVEGGDAWTFKPGQTVWARQLNAEQAGLKITNDGASLSVLGLKTEGAGTVARTLNGGRTRVLGGLLYPATAVSPATAAFVNVDSSQSLTFAVSAGNAISTYQVLSVDRCRGATDRTRLGEASRRGAAGATLGFHRTTC